MRSHPPGTSSITSAGSRTGPGRGLGTGPSTAPSTGNGTSTEDTRRWSQAAGRRSQALDLEAGVFTWPDPARIARSLQRSAETSQRRRRPPFASAMAMLCFYINRAGSQLDPERRAVLEQAKAELRRLYGRR